MLLQKGTSWLVLAMEGCCLFVPLFVRLFVYFYLWHYESRDRVVGSTLWNDSFTRTYPWTRGNSLGLVTHDSLLFFHTLSPFTPCLLLWCALVKTGHIICISWNGMTRGPNSLVIPTWGQIVTHPTSIHPSSISSYPRESERRRKSKENHHENGM